jgi:hypothetical protein
MRIRTNTRIGEFRHVGFGDNDRASRPQPVHHWRINCSRFRFLSERLRARTCHLVCNVKQVLDADDSAIELPKRNAGPGARVGGLGSNLCLLSIYCETGPRALPFGIVDAVERGFEPLTGRRWLHKKFLT